MLSHLKICLAAAAIIVSGISEAKTKKIDVFSPDGKIRLGVEVDQDLTFNVLMNNDTVLQDCTVAMEIEGPTAKSPATGRLGVAPKLKSVKRTSVNEVIHPTVALKFADVKNNYNGAILKFAGGYDVEFRVMDNGIAYRFVTAGKDSVNVIDETACIRFAGTPKLHVQRPWSFRSGYEEPYEHLDIADWEPDRLAILPALAEGDNYYVLISESNLRDYPALFLKPDGNDGIQAAFPKYPAKLEQQWDRFVVPIEDEPYIARTAGAREYPWRYMVISDNPSDLATQTLTCQLAGEPEIADTSWIRPGRTAWDWWNGKMVYGPDVDFRYGTNTDTYKYFIDFASKYGIEYVILDEGWSRGTEHPFDIIDEIDLPGLISYGKEKGVDLILWMTWLAVDRNPEVFKHYADMGVAGFKIDFMDRSDQQMVNFYENTVRQAADHGLLIDFHGSMKPAGLEFRYPNLISYEGVLGLEQMGRCQPDNSLYLPFIRNSVGTMDFTPGAMLARQPDVYYNSTSPNAAAVGTKVHQMAHYIVFESGIQMLADSPSLYYQFPDCTEFIVSVPTTWDETRILDSRLGEYIVTAKRKGDDWFVGAIANNGEAFRQIPIDLEAFLDPCEYELTQFVDGPNADRQGMDYRKYVTTITPGGKGGIVVARNGGWAAHFRKIK